jgi:hypothetical protein
MVLTSLALQAKDFQNSDPLFMKTSDKDISNQLLERGIAI